jgi:predicted MFS family arabinose efflux permease
VIGPRRIMALGVIAVPSLMVTLTLDGAHPNAWIMRLQLYAMGYFMAHVFMTSQAAGFATIPPSATGRASTLYNAFRQIGSALGVAIMGTVLATVGTTTRSATGVVRPNLAAYHTAFYVAACLFICGLALVATVNDKDAAPTMVRKGRRGNAPVVSEVVPPEPEALRPNSPEPA